MEKRRLEDVKIYYNYDPEGDVLYINFGEPRPADESTLTEDDVIIRYHEGKIVGMTILHATERLFV